MTNTMRMTEKVSHLMSITLECCWKSFLWVF